MCAFYEPPTQNLPIFDPDVFTQNDEALTIATGSKYFLRFPSAQGEENLQAVNVNGVLTANSSTTLNGAFSVPNNDAFIRGLRIGYGAGNKDRNTVLGANSGINNTIGDDNVFVGSNAGLANTTGSSNIFFGSFAGRFNTIGANNTFVGRDAGNTNVSGLRNSFIGREAGYRCIGNDNVSIGNESDCSGNVNNSIAIGSGVKVDVSNTIIIGLSTQSTRIPGTLNVGKNLTMTSGDPNESQITCGYLNFKDLNGNVARTAEIYQDGTTLNITNEATSGITRFTNDDPTGLPTTIAEFGMNSNVSFYRNLTIRDNKNLVFVGGTGFINQSVVLGDITTKNFFKLSEFQIASNNTNGTPTSFEFYDNINDKGLFMVPNSDNGSLSDTNRRNDCCLTSRAPQNNNAITISNWNTNMRNGLRVFTTDVSNCGLTLQCGQNTTSDWTQFAMNYNRDTLTTTTSFNNVINFNPATGTGLPNAISSARRRLEGLGTLSFTDISGNNTTTGSITSSIWTDSSLVNSLNGMYYDCGINGGFHQFSARDNAGNVSTPIYYGSNITSVSNTFIVRNATTPSNRLDFSVDTAQNTTIRTRTTTPNTSALIFWTCDTCAPSGTVTSNSIMVMTPFYTEIRRPILFNYPTNGPSSASNLGFITGPTAMTTGSSIASSASERNFGSFTIANIGTYSIKVLIAMAGGANHTLTECRWCLDGTSATFPSISTPTRYTPSITGIVGASLSNTYTSYMNINLDITTTSASQIIYVNYVLNYSGGSTTTLNATYSYTRIG